MTRPARKHDWNEIEKKQIEQFVQICESMHYIFPPEFSMGTYLAIRDYLIERSKELENKHGSNKRTA